MAGPYVFTPRGSFASWRCLGQVVASLRPSPPGGALLPDGALVRSSLRSDLRPPGGLGPQRRPAQVVGSLRSSPLPGGACSGRRFAPTFAPRGSFAPRRCLAQVVASLRPSPPEGALLPGAALVRSSLRSDLRPPGELCSPAVPWSGRRFAPTFAPRGSFAPRRCLGQVVASLRPSPPGVALPPGGDL